jgi:membrane-bound lytic murein transglycosylase D
MRRHGLRALTWLAVLALAGCQAPVRPTAPVPTDAPAAEDAAEPARPRRAKPPAAAPTPTRPALELRETSMPAITSGAELLTRLRARLADPPCVKDRVVQRWEAIYAKWPPRFNAQVEAILPLMAMVVEELESHHLPGEFALLPIVESWYRPLAGTPRTAYGMWQFATATARHEDLRIGPGVDERLAPAAATRAAMHYLAGLQNRFGDWRLASMAFNAGEYRLKRALAKQTVPGRPEAARHQPPGLAMTTYEHLAKMQALACLFAEPGRFGLELPQGAFEPVQVAPIPAGLATLDQVAARSGLSMSEVRRLNPGFLDARITRGATREVLLPRSAALRLAQLVPGPAAPATAATPARAAATDAERPPRTYRIRPGDTLGAIARRHGLRLAELLRWNSLDVRALLQPGQVLRLEP